MRLTYRTLRVLAEIAAAPGISNREVAEAAGVRDPGQISKLLARVEGLGLVRNTGGGQAKGAAQRLGHHRTRSQDRPRRRAAPRRSCARLEPGVPRRLAPEAAAVSASARASELAGRELGLGLRAIRRVAASDVLRPHRHARSALSERVLSGHAQWIALSDRGRPHVRRCALAVLDRPGRRPQQAGGAVRPHARRRAGS